MTANSSSSSRLLVSPAELCRSWCEHLAARDVHGTLEIALPGSWLGSEAPHCYVEPRARGFVVTDMGSIFGELWVRGVHRIGHVELYARALGFDIGLHRELSKPVENGSDAAATIAELSQVAALALAEMLRVEFHAPAMVLPDVWRNFLERSIQNEPDAAVTVEHDGMHLDRQNIVRHAIVASYRGRPLVVSPIVGNDSKGEFTKLYYFMEKAADSVRGVMPLIRAKHRGFSPDMIDDLATSARNRRRRFDFVVVQPDDERYHENAHGFPAVQQLEAGAERFAAMYRELRQAA